MDIKLPEIKFEGTLGQDTKEFIKECIQFAESNKAKIIANLNGIEFSYEAGSGYSEDDLYDLYILKSKEASLIDKNSSVCITKKNIKEQLILQAQTKIDQYMGELNDLNFSDFEAVLDRCDRFSLPCTHLGVSYDKEKVLGIFNDNGYSVGVNTGKEFNREDDENYAKYIIGQFLDEVKFQLSMDYFQILLEDGRRNFELLT